MRQPVRQATPDYSGARMAECQHRGRSVTGIADTLIDGNIGSGQYLNGPPHRSEKLPVSPARISAMTFAC